MSTPILRFGASGAGVHVDVGRLIASRMLLQANSGGGKSRAIRSLLEETHGTVQQFIIDPEGEFATLREKFDYVLAAKTGGDVLASPKTAKLLCRKLVELGASAVLDLYDLQLYERREFVKVFLTELMALPRILWRPILVVVDEAHVFAPERGSGESQSLEAVIALCTQGRKRGFCGVLATQRISKLHKDAAAELLNKMIGRTGLDVDVDRAAKELGFDKESRAQLPRLEPGEFFVYGPAISNTVAKVRTGDVKTTHPEAGTAGSVAPAPPAKVKAMLAKLVDLPKEAEAEAHSIVELRQENATLKGKLTRLEREGPAKIVEKKVVDQNAIAKAVATAQRDDNRRFGNLAKAVMTFTNTMRARLDELVRAIEPHMELAERPQPVRTIRHGMLSAQPKPLNVGAMPTRSSVERSDSNGHFTIPKGEKVVLVAIAAYEDGVDRDQLSVLTGYKRSSRDAYISRAQARGHIQVNGGRVSITEDGIVALGDDYEPLPTGDALREHWLKRLPDGERRVLEVLLAAYPDAVSRATIDEQTEYKRSSRDAYISRLKSRRLITLVGSDVRASETLFS